MSVLAATVGQWARSPAFKLLLIATLILLLLIPLTIVYALINEREMRASGVRAEVGRIWGPEQNFTGPLIVVPYSVRIETTRDGKPFTEVVERRAMVTPDRLSISVDAKTKTLRRSILEVPVYGADVKMRGSFAAPRVAELAGEGASIRWRDAIVSLGISGVSGLKNAAVLKIAGAGEIPFAPSLGIPQTSAPGIHARLAAAGAGVAPPDAQLSAFDFEIDLALNGSVALRFAPVAKETVVKMTSDWRHPSFDGAFLPDDREIDDAGFTAAWKIPHLARSVPEAWVDGDAGTQPFSPYVFGVSLVDPVDFYSLVDRATKYGALFVTLAFMAVFCVEMLYGRAVHPVQYLFAGIALVFFYVLLLSLAEHIGFAAAYALASLATGAMLAAYLGAVMRSARVGAVMMGVFTVTYVLLYVILRLEDYALLAGSLLGFAALTIVMFATLRIDWSGRTRSAVAP